MVRNNLAQSGLHQIHRRHNNSALLDVLLLFWRKILLKTPDLRLNSEKKCLLVTLCWFLFWARDLPFSRNFSYSWQIPGLKEFILKCFVNSIVMESSRDFPWNLENSLFQGFFCVWSRPKLLKLMVQKWREMNEERRTIEWIMVRRS